MVYELVTSSDKKIGNDSSGVINYYIAEVLSQNDYYPFGMLQPGRSYTAVNNYRYGFNGKENDNSTGNDNYDFGARIYDGRIGKFLSRDPLFVKTPYYSPYLFAGNKPIIAIDKDGEIEVIVNVYEESKDGKTMILKYTNRFIIETVEDLKGIDRTPLIVNVYTQVKTQEYRQGNMTTYYDIPVAYAAAIQNGSGESYEDRTWKTSGDKVSKGLLKTALKLWPPAKIADGLFSGDRDPITQEYRHPAKKYLQVVEGIFDIITLGRGVASNDAAKAITMNYFKKVVDWGAEEIIKLATNKLGMGKEKANILSYYVIKFAYEAKTGEISSLYKTLQALIKLGSKKSDEVIESEFEKIGINLNGPKDKSEAAKKAVTATGFKDLKIIQ